MRWMDGSIDFNGHEFEQTLETGMLQSTGSKRVGHNIATEQQQEGTAFQTLGVNACVGF